MQAFEYFVMPTHGRAGLAGKCALRHKVVVLLVKSTHVPDRDCAVGFHRQKIGGVATA